MWIAPHLQSQLRCTYDIAVWQVRSLFTAQLFGYLYHINSSGHGILYCRLYPLRFWHNANGQDNPRQIDWFCRRYNIKVLHLSLNLVSSAQSRARRWLDTTPMSRVITRVTQDISKGRLDFTPPTSFWKSPQLKSTIISLLRLFLLRKWLSCMCCKCGILLRLTKFQSAGQIYCSHDT
jgi:hypothetical protein